VKRVRTITVRTLIVKGAKSTVRRSTAAVTRRSPNAITMLPEAALPAPTVKVIRIPASSVRVRPGR
jgi:hypothetical protein